MRALQWISLYPNHLADYYFPIDRLGRLMRLYVNDLADVVLCHAMRTTTLSLTTTIVVDVAVATLRIVVQVYPSAELDSV